MNLIKHALVLATGAAFGVVSMLSCSDSTPRPSDAATCDCPASEPPLADRIVLRDDIQTMGPIGGPEKGEGLAGTACAPGTQFLSGSCSTATADLPDITLRQAGFVSDTGLLWTCSFKNNTTVPVQIKATVVCLKPAS